MERLDILEAAACLAADGGDLSRRQQHRRSLQGLDCFFIFCPGTRLLVILLARDQIAVSYCLA
jgi:hypothetical protein